MTVSTEVDHNDYTGNGVTTSFPYTFRIFQKTDLMVQVVDLSENISILVLDTDYSVTGAGTYSGGSVVLTSPLANAWQISISRELPATQETDLRNQGKFFAEVHEDAFDKLTMLIQQCFSFLRLALRKPSFIATYYDALNNRIRNLRDPSQAQDAATKNYVDSQIVDNTNAWQEGDLVLDQKIDANFSRTLRTKENISQVPSKDIRSGMLLGFNDSGNPVAISGQTDTADLALKLASSTGADLVYLGEASVALLMQRSIFQYMSATDIENITSTLGAVVNVDYALQKAIDDGVTSVYYPPCIGWYEHSDSVTLPSGFNMRGHSRRPYTISSDASFNNCGTVIRLKSGSSGLFILSGRHTFTDIVFDGVDKTVGMMNAASQVSGCRFERCGAYRWSRGFGRSSGYVATLYARGCNASGNINGFYNLIDSSVMDSVVNANESHGVNFQTGANNNSLVRCRVEWNDGYGLFANGATGNIFTGEMIDRNGLAAAYCLASGNWIINAAIVRRSGRLAASGNADNCHFRIEGSGSSIIVDGIRTAAGADDDGGGTITPEYGIITTGSSSNLSVTVGNSLMTGYTIAATNQIVTPANRNYRNNNGLNDTVTNGISQHANGRSSIGADPGSISLSVGGSAAYTHIQSALTTFSDPVGGVLDIVARNTTLTTAEYFRANVKISRVGSGAAVVALTPITTWNSTNWGLSGSSPTGVSVSASISSDGSTLTVSLQGIDSSARIVRSKFKDL
ncbi:TPA: phage tail fiber protein [Raoultella ornithinolytica]